MCNLRLFLATFTLIGLLAGCSTDSGPPPPLEDGSFSKVASVPATNVATLNSGNGLLLAGTDQGAYKKELDDPEATWRASGLAIDSAEVVDFVIWNEQELLAAIVHDNPRSPRADLFKSINNGNSWNPVAIDYNEEELMFFSVHELEINHNDSNSLFAYTGYVSKSTDGGFTWSNIYAGHISEFLTVTELNPEVIWTGGVNNIFSPYLAKSEDGGDSWVQLNDNFDFNTETTVRDLIVHPTNADRVLAGAGGAVGPANVVRKSTDGGQSWQTVLQGYNIRTLAHSARGQGRVYASGINEARSPFFAASTNFGDGWEIIEMTGATEALFINDMISVMEGGTEVLYFGTTKGVYKYTFEE